MVGLNLFKIIFLSLIFFIVLTGCTSNKVIVVNPPLPAYAFSHTNETIPVTGANEWTNITFGQEEPDIESNILHTHNSIENDTFIILISGIYNIDYDLDVIDQSVGASNIDVAGRLIFENGSEISGSIFETELTKQATETELSHNFLASLTNGSRITFQFIAEDADVEISTHGTFGDDPESATVLMFKIANLK